MQFSRANTKLATNAVPHGTLPGSAADSSGRIGLGAVDNCIAGISNIPPDGQHPLVSTTSPPCNDGAENDPEEISPFLGDEL